MLTAIMKSEDDCFLAGKYDKPRQYVEKQRYHSTDKGVYSQGYCLPLGNFPGGSDCKASTHKVGDLGWIPGSGRSPGEGNGNPLQYSCLENPMDEGAWEATVHGVAKSWTRLSNFTIVFPVVTYSCESWTIKKAECQRIDAFKLWC